MMDVMILAAKKLAKGLFFCVLILCNSNAAVSDETPPDLSNLLAEISIMPEGSWLQVSRNRFDDVWAPAGLRPLVGPSNPQPDRIIAAWSSFAWDSRRGDLVLYGGGHANYSGNEVYRWRGTTQKWERASLPSEIIQDDFGNWRAIDGVNAAPSSAHTYDNTLYLPFHDRVLTFGGAAYNNGGMFIRQVDSTTTRPTGPYLWDPNKADKDKVGGSTGSHVQRTGAHPEIVGGSMWQNRDIHTHLMGLAPLPKSHVEGTTALRSSEGKDVVLVNARPGGTHEYLYQYTVNDISDPAEDTWELVGKFWNGVNNQGAGLFDPVLNLYVRSGRKVIGFWNLSTPGSDNKDQLFYPQSIGDEFKVSRDMGMDYDANRHQYLLWSGFNEVWAIIPPTTASTEGWRAIKQPLWGGDAPNLGPGTGILGRWKYIKQLDVFIGLQDIYRGQIWVYKPIGWESPTLTERTLAPQIAPVAGTYTTPQTVTLTATETGSALLYTLDGGDPTQNGIPYEGPISLTSSATVKAAAVVADKRPSRVMAAEYHFNVSPVISSLTVSSTHITDGSFAQLNVIASDPDNQPQPLQYQWDIIVGQGTIEQVSTTEIRYYPADTNTTELHLLQVSVTDGEQSAVETVYLTVADAGEHPLLFYTAFTEGEDGLPPPDWLVVDEGDIQAPSSWVKMGQQLIQQSNIYANPIVASDLAKRGTVLYYPDSINWQDYQLTTTFYSEDDDAVGVVFRLQDITHYYRFTWNKALGYRRLERRDGEVFSVLAEDTVPYEKNRLYQLMIKAQGNSIEVFIDQNLVFNVNDSVFPQGGFGFYSWANEGYHIHSLEVLDINSSEEPVVAPVIDSLTATPTSVFATEPALLKVVASDSDTPETSLVYSWQVLSGNGILSTANQHTTNYTPSAVDDTEVHTLQVTVSDGLQSTTETLTITVLPTRLTIDLDESFSSGLSQDWFIATTGTLQGPADWAVVDGVLRQSSNVYALPSSAAATIKPGTILFYQSGYSWQDYLLRLKVKSDDDDVMGVLFRVQDEHHYYRFSWSKVFAFRRLEKIVGNDVIVLAEDHVPFSLGQWYSLDIDLQGNTIEVFVDDNLILSASDDTYAQGSIGLYAWANQGTWFDDIKIQRKSPLDKPPVISSIENLPAYLPSGSTLPLSIVASDPENKPLSWHWSVTGPATLMGEFTSTPILSAQTVIEPTTLTITTIVSDGKWWSKDIQQITLMPSLEPTLLIPANYETQRLTSDWWSVSEGTLLAPAKWQSSAGILYDNSNIYSLPIDFADLRKAGSVIYYPAGKRWDNYEIHLQLRSVDDDALGVVFRMQDPQHYYRFEWNKAGNYRRLVRRMGETYTLLAETHEPYILGRWYNVTVKANNHQIEILLDDTLAFQVTDSVLSHGTIGFYTWANYGSQFKNVTVYPVIE
ncbi:family 16 glycoside hydrolase [Zooshikella sp. RANM57]|uniref:family 16 glycoside hydrolase n=1 Tax=Zooshikella sp. RANM57 TaxID=3425863 RepID=UPI003D6F7189